MTYADKDIQLKWARIDSIRTSRTFRIYDKRGNFELIPNGMPGIGNMLINDRKQYLLVVGGLNYNKEIFQESDGLASKRCQ